MKTSTMAVALCIWWCCAQASAQIGVVNPFVTALSEGKANAALPQSRMAEEIVKKIQARTGSPGEVTIEFIRIVRFVQQPACGRIAFGLYQASTKTFFSGQLGGQLNICSDGSPPLRRCAGSSGLVPADSRCANGSSPVETVEVAEAIAKALASGSKTAAQVKQEGARQ